jgi:hypothetical protein
VVCFAGCDDELDILPALEMTVADLYDEPRASARKSVVDPEKLARIETRRQWRAEKQWSRLALDDLLHLPDIGERLCMGIARMRPELYIWEREQLAGEING